MPTEETLNKIKAFKQKVWALTSSTEKATSSAKEILLNGDPWRSQVEKELTAMVAEATKERVTEEDFFEVEKAMDEFRDAAQILENALAQLED